MKKTESMNDQRQTFTRRVAAVMGPTAIAVSLTLVLVVTTAPATAQEPDAATMVDYNTHVLPILEKYCISCHNEDSFDGELSMESYEALVSGGTQGIAVLAGDAASSRLIRVLNGEAEPAMPPDEMAGPRQDELNLLIRWIDAGAPGPSGQRPDRSRLIVPQLPAAEGAAAITAMAWSPTQDMLAVARFKSVELIQIDNGNTLVKIDNLPGKINQLVFSDDGEMLIGASGVTGLVGVAIGWNTNDGSEVFRVEGHSDSLYAVAMDASKQRLATAGYDKTIKVWDVDTQKPVQNLQGHNQPVFSLDFHPTLPVLVSASADETLKVWNTESGERLDTLSQPLAEQYVARFTPDGTRIIGAGADNRIRVWRLESRDKPAINPLLHAMFAHEGPIAHVDFSSDGSRMVSVAEDRTVKVWNTDRWQQLKLLPAQPAFISAVAMSPGGTSLRIGRMDGSLEAYVLDAAETTEQTEAALATVQTNSIDASLTAINESEPNSDIGHAQTIKIPTRVSGVIGRASSQDSSADQLAHDNADLFRFSATAGSSWVMEVNAARAGSPLDSMLEVLDAQGEPIERVLLQAVRDSYFTFRGKDSSTSDDFRVHNWEEMELNEYLYADGEVVKLWLYPRGPDSGFKVYPGTGARHAYFGTTPLAHALQAPCYIVEPHAPGTALIPNGLPVFRLYWENDDDSKRQLGSDSRLIFVAPTDGEYVLRLTDARGFSGPDFKYEVTIRPAHPNFRVQASKISAEVSPGSGREFTVNAQRLDGFDDAITVEVNNLPAGFHASSPIQIEAGQYSAKGMIWADDDASAPAEDIGEVELIAWAEIAGERVEHKVNSIGRPQLAANASLRVRLLALPDEESHQLTSADPLDTAAADHALKPSDEVAENESTDQTIDAPIVSDPLVLTIRPGETIAAKVRVERNGHQGLVSFGKEDSGRNLPHGVYVDNIGLNGLMIVEGQSERTFFLTCADWVQPQERLFYLRAEQQGGQCSLPAVIRVLPVSSEQ